MKTPLILQGALLAMSFSLSSLSAATLVVPGEDLQAVLDRGEDLALEKGQVYEVEKTLRYKTEGQRIFTMDAEFISDFATLKIANKDLMMLINVAGVGLMLGS